MTTGTIAKRAEKLLPRRILTNEKDLWLEYLRTDPYKLHHERFDVNIIPNEKTATWAADNWKKNWDKLNCPRADIIAKGELNTDYVIELKEEATFQTLAQVMAYMELAAVFGIVSTSAHMLIITRTISDTTAYLADRSGILIHRLVPKK
jgi:hypothetical protein